MDYKDKLERAKKLYETANKDQRYVLESLFPEIQEDNNEKIVKKLKELIIWAENNLAVNPADAKTMLNWLEKQDSTKQISLKYLNQ